MNLATATPARILIVEDDADAARLLESLLRAAQHQIVGTVGSGQEALRLAESARPDLVIMDIMLSGDLDGIETATLLAERQGIPVLYLTAYSDQELYARARATSPVAYLHKPCDARELQRAIDLALDRHALLRQLKASQAHLAEAQAVAHIGSWHWHLAEDRVEVSGELLRLLDLAPGSFEPRFDTFLQMACEADRPVMLAAMETLLRGEEAGEIDVRLDSATERVLRLLGHPHFDAQGRPAALVGTARDVTAEWRARQEAEAYREQLETRVAERTAELSAANTLLQAEIENRRRMEEALWLNEQRYRGLVDNLPEPMLVMQNNQVVFANPALARLLGLPATTATLGMALTDLVQTDFRQVCEACQQATLAGQTASAPTVMKLRSADGGSVEVEALTFAFDYEGRPAVLAVMRDLTARRAMEMVAARFRVALDSSPDAVCLIDPESMRFVDINATACASLGYSRDELLQLGPQDIKPHFNKSMLRKHFAAVFAGDPAAEIVQTLHRRKDGSTFPVEIRLRPFESVGQALIVAVARDISERVRAEAELRETNERFQQLAGNIDEAFWIRDLVENRFLYVNPAYEKLYGKSVDSLYRHSRSFLASIHPDDRDRVAAAHDAQRALPSGLDLEYRVVVAGRTRWMWVRTFPIRDADGKAYRTVGVAKDVTERRESEEQFRAIIQTSMDGFWMTDTQNHILDCNAAYCRMSGYSREELLTLSISDLKIGESPEELLRRTERIMARGCDSFESRHRRKDGRLLELEVNVYYRPGEEGGRLFAFLRDISERKQTEHALIESEARYRAVVEDQTEIICRFGADGIFTFASEVFCRFFGKTAQEIVGKPWHPVAYPEDMPLIEAKLQTLTPSNPVVLIENRVYSGSGELRWMQFVNRAFYDGNGRIFEIQSVGRDISDRKQAELALRQSESRSRSILRAAPVGIGVLVDRVFQEVNQAMTNMTGYAAEELIGHPTRMLYLSQTDFEYVGTEYAQLMERGFGSLESRWRRKDGKIIDVALSSSLIVAGDLTQGVTFAAQDITASKQAEQQRLVHEANQRSALVREVHHRIKNNLQGVIGLLRQHIAAHPDTRQPIESAIAQINTIAAVHGLQGRMPQNELRLRELLREVNGAVTAMTMLPHPPPIDDTLSGDVWLDSGAAVSIALILNELLHNALKHGQHADGTGVAIALRGDRQQVSLRIVNPGGPLPAGFDLTSGQGCGTGLDLIRTLLPRRGASLEIHDGDGRIESELVLGPPLTTEPELPA